VIETINYYSCVFLAFAEQSRDSVVLCGDVMIGDERRNDGKTNDDDRQFSIKSDRNGNDDSGGWKKKEGEARVCKKEVEVGAVKSNIAISFEINWIEERTLFSGCCVIESSSSSFRRVLGDHQADLHMTLIRCKHPSKTSHTKKKHMNEQRTITAILSLGCAYYVKWEKMYNISYLSNELLN
jgi:hypothetical protein